MLKKKGKNQKSYRSCVFLKIKTFVFLSMDEEKGKVGLEVGNVAIAIEIKGDALNKLYVDHKDYFEIIMQTLHENSDRWPL
jgi:hypothetical protein